MPINTTIQVLNRAQYAGLDFDTHEDDLRARIQINFAASYNDFAVSSMGIVLLDVIAFGLDTLSFYLDRRVTDTYLATARTRKSVTRLCRQLGYRLRGAVSSGVDVDITPGAGAPVPFTLPKGFQLKGPSDLIFETAQSTLFSGVSKQTIACYEGQTLHESFTSDGTPNQVFQLNAVPAGLWVIDGTIIVTVAGTPWVENEFLTFETTNQYEFSPTDVPPSLRFGDGVAGNIPAAGVEIKVSYVAAKGLQGQATAETIVDSVLPLVVAFNTVPLTIFNPKGAVGGDDPETIEHAQVFAAMVWKSRHVAITREDYEALSGSYADPLFGKVSVAQAISARSAAGDVELQNRIITINSLVESIVPGVSAAVADARMRIQPALALEGITSFIDAGGGNVLVTFSSAKHYLAAGDLMKVSGTAGGYYDGVFTIVSVPSVTQVLVAHGFSGTSTGLWTRGDAGILQLLDDILTSLNSVGAHLTAADGQLQSAIADARVVRNKTVEINAQVGVGNAKVSGFPTATPSQLTAADAAELTAYFNAILSASTNIDSQAASEIGAMGVARDEMAAAGLSIASGDLLVLETKRQEVLVHVGAVATAGIQLDLADVMTSTVDVQVDVETETSAIWDHVDKILSADCQANLVVVPILTKDPAGFFAAPSTGLIRSLQAYLDARKEVTQTVKVTSGANSLVPAVVVVRVGVTSGYALTVVASNVASVIDGLLRDRKFGQSLYVSSVYDAIIAGVQGISFLNVEILGPALYLDSSGNLVVDSSKVITKDTVTVTPEVVV